MQVSVKALISLNHGYLNVCLRASMDMDFV